MSHDTPRQRFKIVPSDDLECVWMSAGLLAYQLCDRGFECERCPLDAALRTHFRRCGPDTPGPRVEPQRSEALTSDRHYSPNHCWVRTESPEVPGTARCRVGIEPGLAAILPLPHALVLPRVGETVQRGRAHLWVVVEGGTFPIAAPADGTIVEVNAVLAERPGLLVSSPLDQGWLYELDAPHAAAQLAALLGAEHAGRGYAADSRRFHAGLARDLNRHRAVGPTLPDGGAPIGDLAQMLGPARYFELLCRVYG